MFYEYKSSVRAPLSALLLSTSLSLSVTALAQSAPENASDDIIVTATKIEATPEDLGLSVSVVTSDEINRFDGAEDLSQYVAGLQTALANGSQAVFQIRGIGAVDHQALTPTATAVYSDGVFLATNVQSSPLLFDTQRAEVIKGPQGSLYGRNATGGAINFISVKPTDASEGYIRGEYGRFNRFNLRAAATVPVSDIFSLRISGRYLSQDPTIDNVVTDPTVTAPKEAGGVRDEFGLRAIGRLQASPNTEVLLNVHYAEDNGINASPRNESLTLGKHEISVGPNGIQDTDNEFYGASATVTHKQGDLTFTSLTAYEGYNQQYGFDFAALPGFFGGQTANLAYDRDFAQVSQELRLAYSGDRLESMGGIYLESESFDQEYLVFCGALNADTNVGSCNYIAAPRRVGAAHVPAGASASTLQSLITQDRQTAAAFTYNTFALTPRLSAVFGARLTYENIQGRGRGQHIFDNGLVGVNNTFATDTNGNPVVLGAAIGSNRIKETRLSGNAGLNFAVTDNSLVYANWSNGFKSGGFNGEVIDNAAHFLDDGLFGPETVNAFEGGWKYKTSGVKFNVAAFYNDYNDPQARFFQTVNLGGGQSVGLNTLSNFAGAVSYGIEADISATLFEGFDVMAAVTVLESEINDPTQPSLDGDALPFASDFSGTLNASYLWDVSDTVKARLTGQGKYQSAFTTGADTATASAFKQDGYEILDARAELIFESGLELGVWGRNLTNSDYATSAYQFFGATTFRGAPRTYGVSVGYNY